MKLIKTIIPALLIFALLTSCDKDNEIDKERPKIDLSAFDAFPVNCDTLYLGETFNLKMLFKDNAELGSYKAYSIDIHNNFDHHSHSTEPTQCSFDTVKTPVNPLAFIMDYDIPEGLTEYQADIPISLANGDNNGQFDEGDYHLYVSLTDKEGWSTQKGLSIKILRR